ncbi:MAG: acyltransferase [Prevotella sp.]|nr:acyltransferase [Prevotella sp.]
MENSTLSKTISCLRFPLMVGIVFIHFNISDGFALHGTNYGGGSPEWYRTVIYLFSEVLPRIGVPLFFFFSGFLLFFNSEWNAATYKRKLKRRARTLLLPYFLWNIIAIAWQGFKLLPCFAKIFPNAGKISIDWSLSAIACTFWDNSRGLFVYHIDDLTENITNSICPIDVPLWYVRDLMIAIICAPIVYGFIKKTGYFLPIVLGLAWYFIHPYNVGYPHQLLTAFFFFSWGAFYSIHRTDFTTVFRKLSFVPLLYIITAASDIITKEQAYNNYIHDFGILLGVVSAIIITASPLERGTIRVNPFLAGASFFIFALHYLILVNVGKIVFAPFRCGSPYFLIAFYFFVPALTILICLGLYKLLRKYCPALASLLTGGR